MNIIKQAKQARAASLSLAVLSTKEKNKALMGMAADLSAATSSILKANALDVAMAKQGGLSASMIERLLLDKKRVTAMADSIIAISRLPDPNGTILETRKRPNGLVIKKITVPIGVVAVIYESRPNVTADCAALCLKSGNAVILKGGKEAFHSNLAIYKVLRKALSFSQIPVEALQFVGTTDRKIVTDLLKLDQWIDLVVPRGGENLIRFVAEHSRIPVIKHFKGVCHIYVSAKADLKQAADVCFNAKVQRPGVCNAMEKMLVDVRVANKFLPEMMRRFRSAGVEVRGDSASRAIVTDLKRAVAQDWTEEYLDLVLAVKVVNGVQAAVDHINVYGSRHSDAIITRDKKEADTFLRGVDSACVYHNASTRFTDGCEFGLGAEVGISTDKIHARGPMGLAGLTSYKFQIYGDGQIRT